MTRSEQAAGWLLGVLIALSFAIVTLGGYVRLTDSGLSIPEWPFFTVEVREQATGELVERRSLLPPRDDEGWMLLRDTFVREVPRFEGTGLAPFKRMFWIEWSHRAVAKVIGFVYLAFLGVVFWYPELRRRIGTLAVVGLVMLVVQAILGGIAVLFHLQPVQVALHLIVAFFFVSVLLWALLVLLRPPAPPAERAGANPILSWSIGLYALFAMQVFSGGLVAGSHAGFQFNSWPKMGDYWVPPGLRQAGEGLYETFTENVIFIQFFHRWFAFLVLLAAIAFVARTLTIRISPQARWAVRALLAVVVLQIILGIFTLVFGVPMWLALTHQSVGLVMLLNALVILYETSQQKVTGEFALAEEMEREQQQPADGNIVNA